MKNIYWYDSLFNADMCDNILRDSHTVEDVVRWQNTENRKETENQKTFIDVLRENARVDDHDCGTMWGDGCATCELQREQVANEN